MITNEYKLISDTKENKEIETSEFIYSSSTNIERQTISSNIDTSELSDTKLKSSDTMINYSSQFIYESNSNILEKQTKSPEMETNKFTGTNELSDTNIKASESLIEHSSQFTSKSSSNIKTNTPFVIINEICVDG